MLTLINRIFDKGLLPSSEVKVNVTLSLSLSLLFQENIICSFLIAFGARKRFLNVVKWNYNGNHYSYNACLSRYNTKRRFDCISSYIVIIKCTSLHANLLVYFLADLKFIKIMFALMREKDI